MKRTILVLQLVFVLAAQGQTAVQAWVQRYGGSGHGDDVARAIAVDTNGNVYVTGSAYSGSSSEYATVAYSNSGTPLWTNRYGGHGINNDIPVAIGVDDFDHVYVTGSTQGTAYATLAYSNAGMPLWTNIYEGAGLLWRISGLAVDTNGNVFVTGPSATVAYSSAGVTLWTNRLNASGAGTAIAVDNSGHVFVTGRVPSAFFSKSATIAYSTSGTPLWTNYCDEGSESLQHNTITVDHLGHVFTASAFGRILVAYTDSGVPLWTNSIGPGAAIGVGNSGNVFLTGALLFSGAGNDYATVAYSNTGLPLWTNRYNGPANGNDQATALAVDGMGNVFVTGSSANSAGLACATIGYSDAGTPLWTNRYSGVGNGTNYANAIAVDRSGNVFVTGKSWNGSNFDYVTIKYALSVPFQFQAMNNQLVLSWTNAAFGWTNLNFTLQSAPTTDGTFTNLPGATSPYTNPFTGAQQFFRLISN